MNSRPASLVAALGLALCACGNYSNDDLDFQLALPEQGDIEAKLQLSVNRPGTAAYYRDTRDAVAAFNAMVDKLTGLIDRVRGNVPTSRNGDERTWGPWPAENHPDWRVRVVMRRSTVSDTQLRIDYSVQVSPQGAADSTWVSFLTGWYVSGGSARIGQGEIHLFVDDVRAAGFPVDDDPGLVNLQRLDVTYANDGFPVTVTLDIAKLKDTATESLHYEYRQQVDGAGQMSFDWQGLSDAGTPIAARMQAQWIGSGAGRADLILDPTGSPTILGTDCWGVDAMATYSYRLNGAVEGDPASCLF